MWILFPDKQIWFSYGVGPSSAQPGPMVRELARFRERERPKYITLLARRDGNCMEGRWDFFSGDREVATGKDSALGPQGEVVGMERVVRL